MTLPKKEYNKEVMREYSFDELLLKATVRLCLGDIVSLKALAIRKGFDELAEKLRKAKRDAIQKSKKRKN